MEARATNFLSVLKKADQFAIPIYQRAYSWTLEQCRQLWNDISRVALNDTAPNHFMGSIVYIQKGGNNVFNQSVVIDGQQRLTTLSLLLAALGRVISETRISVYIIGEGGEKVDVNRKKLSAQYLFNSVEDGDNYYKLLLTRGDKSTFMALLEDREPLAPVSKHLKENYDFFLMQVREWGQDLGVLFQGINKLVIVDVSLEQGRDNPQLIFESLNSTGLDLSQTDLIRNYLLMDLDNKEQKELYERYWYPMEQGFSSAEANQFDRFVRDYLTVKTRQIPKLDRIYESFKTYTMEWRGGGGTTTDLIAEIARYARYFVRLALEVEEDRDIREAMSDINRLKVDVAYPFLLEVYDDYAQGLLLKPDLVAILRLIESYIFRRAVCDIATNSLNKTFPNLSKEIDKSNYLKSVQKALLARTSYARFPNDEEFRRMLVERDIYGFGRRKYLLSKLENFGSKEQVATDNLTAEHIMPQNERLSQAWRGELGPKWKDIQRIYLHTLGNMTLTGYNSELGDRPFIEKRDMVGGFASSPLRLNRSVAKLDHWNEEAINQRAAELANIALQIWPMPKLPAEMINTHRPVGSAKTKRTYSIEEHLSFLVKELHPIFEELRQRILSLEELVREDAKAMYIAYKTNTNFVDVSVQKRQLVLTLNMRYDEIIDPEHRCKDVTNIGKWGNGDVQVNVTSGTDLDYVMGLIRQSFAKHWKAPML